MVRTRQAKVDGIAATIPPLEVDDPTGEARRAGARLGLDVRPDRRGRAGWSARRASRSPRPTCGTSTRSPPTSARCSRRYDKVLIPEMNLGYGFGGQLSMLIRAKYLVDAIGYNQVRGLPFKAEELADVITTCVDDIAGETSQLNRGVAVSTTPGPQGFPALDLVPKAREKQSAKDFKTDQEVRWCPGCGDYAILAAVQGFMPELGLARENIVFVSGIGCSSRFPYYMNTYGMHSIHGRAPAIATGLAASRPDLSVWVVTGDGDALSIGGNHLIHALRRNVNLKILLFNNRIYGLTKGQYSPTSELGKITKSTPMGSLDSPVQPGVAGARRRGDVRRADASTPTASTCTSVLRAAAAHQGTALVEIYQNCNIFNDGAFEPLKDPETRDDFTIRLEHGQPITWGANGEHGVVRDHDTALKVVETADVDAADLVVHDAHQDDPSHAFALSRLAENSFARTPIGVFRDVERPVVRRPDARAARERRGHPGPDRSGRAGRPARRLRHLDRSVALGRQPPGHRVRRLGVPAVGAVPALLAAARAGQPGRDPGAPDRLVAGVRRRRAGGDPAVGVDPPAAARPDRRWSG